MYPGNCDEDSLTRLNAFEMYSQSVSQSAIQSHTNSLKQQMDFCVAIQHTHKTEPQP